MGQMQNDIERGNNLYHLWLIAGYNTKVGTYN